MRIAARRNPRLDPRLPPDQWEESRRRYMIRLVTSLVLLAIAAAVGGYYYVGVYVKTLDKTQGLQPEQVVEAAGLFLAKAERYRFTAELTGESGEGYFPNATMQGAYQRDPLVLHLSGEAGSAENKVPLEYYLAGVDLYLKNPRSNTWMRVENAELDELYAFQPDNLAAPLVTGLRKAEEIRREQTADGEAVVYGLDLDPEVMRVQPVLQEGERVEYRLWVDTRNLRPIQFQVTLSRNSENEMAPPPLRFQYRITWDFSKQGLLEVPEPVLSQVGEGGSK